MSAPYYVSPEQLMRDKAEFAKAGISRGRAIVTVSTVDGILFVAHNPGAALKKLSEVYDRIGFAGVGRYSEFEHLRKAGIRHADVTGFSYSREDVSAKALADGYSQMLGEIFAHDQKPMEVELVLAQVGPTPEEDEIYRISFDGSISGAGLFAVVGGDAEEVLDSLKASVTEVSPLADSMGHSRDALQAASENGELKAQDFEVALLRRGVSGRAFTRLAPSRVESLLAG